ncbi:MAG TPA: DnaB-like helicase N-terminal domain-containing protein [Kamptonema sp.]|nr:DnaB-like helicase N-terminal domain-containing protein [Kamptonema sp.]
MSELLPTNLEAEEAILGGILIDRYALSRIAHFIRMEHFAIESHQIIYKAMMKLYKLGGWPDLMLVASELMDRDELELVGGQYKLAELAERTVSAANIDKYAELIVEKYVRRRLIYAGNEAVKISQNQSNDILEIQQQISEMFEVIKSEKMKVESNDTAISLSDFLSQAPSKPTRWLVKDLFRCGDIVLICGASGSGKSTVMSSIFRCIAKGEECLGKRVSRGKVLWHTSDESVDDLVIRLTGKWETNSENPDCWAKNFIKLRSDWNINHLSEIEELLKRDAEENEFEHRIKAICIDSLSTAIAYPLNLDINRPEIGGYISRFKPMVEKYGVSVFIIHHENKDKEAKGIGKANGSLTIVNNVDMMVSISGNPRTGVFLKAQKVRSVISPWSIEAVLENEPHILGIDGSLSCHLILQSCVSQEIKNQGSEKSELTSLSPRAAIANFLSANKGKWYRRVDIQEATGHTGEYQTKQYTTILKEMASELLIAKNPNPKHNRTPEYGHIDNALQTGT